MIWFIALSVVFTAALTIRHNAKRWAREYQAARNAKAYKRYAQGVKDLEASMGADGVYNV